MNGQADDDETKVTGPPSDQAEPDDIPGVVGGFEVVNFLGRGGVGRVYRALQKSIGRYVALKVLDPARAADPEFVTRFEREAKLAGSLSHSNVVGVIDAGVDEESKLHFIAFEHIERHACSTHARIRARQVRGGMCACMRTSRQARKRER